MRHSVLFLCLLALAAFGCADPTTDKPKAEVEAPAPTPEPVAGGVVLPLAEGTTLGFVGSKVTGSHDGGFKTFTATVDPADGKVEGGSVSVEIDVDSMFTDSEKLTGHLKGPDFFGAEANPKATFQSSEIKAGGSEGYTHTVVGNLALHGVTKKITFPANIEMDSGTVKVKSEFSINRKDFEMGYAGMPDDLIRDEVVIKLDLTFDAKA